jgi:arylsulfatase
LPDVLTGYKWELYNLIEDYSQYNDLAAKRPDKLAELKKVFTQEATKYQVFPLDNRAFVRMLTPRPSATAGQNVFTYSGEISGISPGTAPPFLGRSFTITADIEVPQGGAEGMLVANGGETNGYGLYLLKGKPVFTYNFLGLERVRWEGPVALTSGKHSLMFDFKYDGPGMAKGGTGILSVDGKEVARKSIPHTIPALMTIDESFDVGVDTRTSVEDNDYQPPFRFTGKLDKLTIRLFPPKMTAGQEKHLKQATQEARNAAQ